MPVNEFVIANKLKMNSRLFCYYVFILCHSHSVGVVYVAFDAERIRKVIPRKSKKNLRTYIFCMEIFHFYAQFSHTV